MPQISRRRLLCLFAVGLTVFGARPVLGADGATFAEHPKYQSDGRFTYAFAVDPSKKSFTATFGGLDALEARIAGTAGRDNAPIAVRSFATVIPMMGSGAIDLPLYFSGYTVTEKTAQTLLLITVNGQTSIAKFEAGSDKSFVHQVDVKMPAATELRIAIVLHAERDSGTDAHAYLNIAAIDTDLERAKHSSEAAKQRAAEALRK